MMKAIMITVEMTMTMLVVDRILIQAYSAFEAIEIESDAELFDTAPQPGDACIY